MEQTNTTQNLPTVTPTNVFQEILKAGFFFSVGYFVNELTASKRRGGQKNVNI